MKMYAFLFFILFSISPCQSIKMNASQNAASITETALNSDNAKSRKAAVKKITDQNTLLEVVLNENYPTIRLIAVKKLTHQHILSHLALNDVDYKVRLAAINSLTSYSLLLEIAEKVIEPELKELAMGRSEKYIPSNLRIYSPRYF